MRNENNQSFVDRVYHKFQSYMTKRVFDAPFRMKDLYQKALSEMIELSKINEEQLLNVYNLELSHLENHKSQIISRIDYLNNQINQLDYQIQIYEEKLNHKQVFSLLFQGKEKELHDAEQRDMILYLIEEELKTEKDSDRINLLNAILDENPKQGTREKLIEEMTRILRSPTGMIPKVIEDLRK